MNGRRIYAPASFRHPSPLLCDIFKYWNTLSISNSFIDSFFIIPTFSQISSKLLQSYPPFPNPLATYPCTRNPNWYPPSSSAQLLPSLIPPAYFPSLTTNLLPTLLSPTHPFTNPTATYLPVPSFLQPTCPPSIHFLPPPSICSPSLWPPTACLLEADPPASKPHCATNTPTLLHSCQRPFVRLLTLLLLCLPLCFQCMKTSFHCFPFFPSELCCLHSPLSLPWLCCRKGTSIFFFNLFKLIYILNKW